MEIFKATSIDEVNIIWKQKSITLEDRFKLDSYTHRTLAEEYDDLTNSEVSEIHRLEIQNLKRLLNSVHILCGVYGKDALDDLLNTKFAQAIREEAAEQNFDDELTNRFMFSTLLSYLMAELDYHKLKYPTFVGKVPQKLFKFRQLTAENWWASYIQDFSKMIGFIYGKLGADDASAYAMCNIAYYLNKSQPFKFYPKSSDLNMGDTIYRICKEYLGEMFGDTSVLQKGNIVFYKDL